MYLKRAVTVVPWANQGYSQKVTFPAGTRVKIVGGPGGGYAIDDLALIVSLTKNEHDATHRYVWVDEGDVTPLRPERGQ